jgi:uncharacterized protein (TIGR00730 family)
LEIIYGGAKSGMAGLLADAALEKGGRVIGVMPEEAIGADNAHADLTEVHPVPSLWDRNRKMADLADAILVLPGGLGTFADLFDMATQPGGELKPCGILNLRNYFDHQLAQLDMAVAEGLMPAAYRRIVLSHSRLDDLLRLLALWQGPTPERRAHEKRKIVVPHKHFQNSEWYWFYEHEMKELDDRRRLGLEMRTGLLDGKTYGYREIAGRLDLTTGERVRQLQNSALRKCREQREPAERQRVFERRPAVEPERWKQVIEEFTRGPLL